MTPTDNDKQSQPMSPPPVLPTSWQAEESPENKKTHATGHSHSTSARAACCSAFLLTSQSTNVSECHGAGRRRPDPAARRRLGISATLASGPVLLCSDVQVGARHKAHRARPQPQRSAPGAGEVMCCGFGDKMKNLKLSAGISQLLGLLKDADEGWVWVSPAWEVVSLPVLRRLPQALPVPGRAVVPADGGGDTTAVFLAGLAFHSERTAWADPAASGGRR